MEKLFTVLHRPDKTWKQKEVIKLVRNLPAGAAMKPTEFPHHVILSGHHAKQRIADILGEISSCDIKEANGYNDPILPFIPGKVP